VIRRFFTNPKTGELVVAQWPNTALWAFLGTSIVRRVVHLHGAVETFVAIVAAVSLGWWAVDEIVRGESPFRRVLGGVVLAALVLGLAFR